MKKAQNYFKTTIVVLLVLVSFTTFSQQGINYQGVARDASDELLISANITLDVNIYKTSPAGTLVYSEVHNTTTDINGVFSVIIGQGTPIFIAFDSVNWAEDNHYLNVWLNGTDVGTTQFQATPYTFAIGKWQAQNNGLTPLATGGSIFIGDNAGANDDLSDNYNIAIGNDALTANTIGSNNIAIGYQTLYSNTTGVGNTANGYQSLFSNTVGYLNVANGYQSLYTNTTGPNNTANGYQSLYTNTTGSFNTANGTRSLYNNTTGRRNIANGSYSLYSNIDGDRNTSNGFNSLYFNTSGDNNTANGYQSLYTNTTGVRNTANGSWSLYTNTTGDENTANGFESLYSNATGTQNTANGYQSLYSNLIGTNNTALGVSAFSIGQAHINSTGLGYDAEPGASNTVRIGNNSVTTIGGYANWTNVSDGRFKINVQDNVKGLDFIMKLKPVTYNLNMDAIAQFNKTPEKLRLLESELLKQQEVQSGFIAQDVERAAAEVGYDFHGVDKPKNATSHYGLRYAEFVVPLVKAIQEQQEIINSLENRNSTQSKMISELDIRLKELEVLLSKNNSN